MERSSARPRRTLFGLALVLAAAAVIRFSVCAVPRMNVDEGWSYYLCRNPLNQMLWYLQKDRHPPLPYLLLKADMGTGGHDETRLRLPFACLAIFNVWLTFVLGRRLFDAQVGLGAAALTAVSFLAWEYDTWMRGYVLLTLFTLLATWMFVGVVERESPRRKFFAVGYALCGALLIYSQYLGILVLAAHLAVALTEDPQGHWLPRPLRLRWLAPCWLTIALLYLPWLPMLNLQSKARMDRDLGVQGDALRALQMAARWLPLETGLENLPLLLRSWTHPFPPQVQSTVRWTWDVGITLLCGWILFCGARLLKGQHAMSFRLLVALVAPAALFIVLIWVKFPELQRVRYYATGIPFVGMFLTAAQIHRRPRIPFAALGLLTLGVNLAVWVSYLSSPYFRSADWKTPALFAKQHQSGAQCIVGYQNHMMHAFNYYYARDLVHYDIADVDHPRYTYDPGYAASGRLPQYRAWTEEVPTEIEKRMRGIDRTLLILWYDFNSPVRQWFRARFAPLDALMVDNHDVDGVAEVYLLERRDATP